MAITAAQVKELRDKTGAGFMDCKSALTEADGDLDKAVTILRTRGHARAAKRSGRTTSQGLVGHYIHMGGQVGVLVEVGCESDFVARTDEFQQLVREIAMHIAAANPLYVTRDQVPSEDVEREQTIFRAQFGELQQAASGHRQDRRRQAEQLLPAGGAGGPALHPRPEELHRRSRHRGDRHDGREHLHRPLRSFQGR